MTGQPRRSSFAGSSPKGFDEPDEAYDAALKDTERERTADATSPE